MLLFAIPIDIQLPNLLVFTRLGGIVKYKFIPKFEMNGLKMKKYFILITALLFSFTLTLLAAPAQLRLGSTETLSGIGVKLRIFRDFSPIPLQFPATRYVRRADKANMFSTVDLWRHRQAASMWRGEGGSMLLGVITLPPPAEKPILEEDATEFFSKMTPPEKWDDKMLLNWVKNFTGLEATSLKEFNRPPLGKTIREVNFTGKGAQNTIAFVIWPSREEKRKFLLQLTASATIEAKQFRKSAEKVINTVEFFRPDASATVRRLNQNTVAESENMQTSREKVIRNIRNLPGWWYLESPNYIFVSNQTDRSGMERIRRQLERGRSCYMNWFPPQVKIDEVSVVRIFNDRDEYLRYAGESMEWTAGYWSANHRELVISPLGQDVSKKIQRKEITETTFHEGFHQYLYYASGKLSYPTWFNEGSAKFFEGIESQGETGQVELPDSNRYTIKRLFASKQEYDLDKLLKMTQEEFYDKKTVSRNYALANALVYYLLKGAPANGEKRYDGIMTRYYHTFCKTKNQETAQKEAFGTIDLKKLSADLTDFWTNERQIKRSIRYKPPKR